MLGTVQPSITPCCSAVYVSSEAVTIAMAPRALSVAAPIRPKERILSPLKSSTFLIGLCCSKSPHP